MPTAYAIKETQTGMYYTTSKLVAEIPYSGLLLKEEHAIHLIECQEKRFRAMVVAPFKKQVLELTGGKEPIYEPAAIEVASIHYVIKYRPNPYSNDKECKYLNNNNLSTDTPFYLTVDEDMAIKFQNHEDASELIRVLRKYTPNAFTSRLTIRNIFTPMEVSDEPVPQLPALWL